MKKLLLFIILLIFLIFSVYYFNIRPVSNVVINNVTHPIVSAFQDLAKATINRPNLETLLTPTLNNYDGNYAVAVKNLSTHETYYYNESRAYQSASLYKLWVMAVAYQQIQNGRFSENQEISAKIEDLIKNYNVDDAYEQRLSETLDYNLNNALEMMITVSDNDAALLLVDKVGISNITNFLKQNKLISTDMGTDTTQPVTSAKDVADFFENLELGKIAKPQYTDKMLTLLRAQKLNSKIPALLPKEVVIGHKTGELDGYSHDAGIVYTPKGNYIIVVLTNTNNPKLANQHIAEISKIVYEYFVVK
ncbi:MAG TPA: serine hydrolase [Candidatus Saccharimonadales bacterium]|nr:serine hydrolase [Candidatus Saccharimonadales bacterium]